MKNILSFFGKKKQKGVRETGSFSVLEDSERNERQKPRVSGERNEANYSGSPNSSDSEFEVRQMSARTSFWKSGATFLWEISKIIIIALLIVVPVRYFLFQPFIVKGASMEPSFHSGDYLIIDEISYRFRQPQRGEVIVFKYPQAPSQRYIKRVIGLPGETIEIKKGQIFISEEGEAQVLDESFYFSEPQFTPGNFITTLKENEYLVLGDNRSFSSDSRHWGSLPENYIIGRALFRAWPPTAIAKIAIPIYQTP